MCLSWGACAVRRPRTYCGRPPLGSEKPRSNDAPEKTGRSSATFPPESSIGPRAHSTSHSKTGPSNLAARLPGGWPRPFGFGTMGGLGWARSGRLGVGRKCGVCGALGGFHASHGSAALFGRHTTLHASFGVGVASLGAAGAWRARPARHPTRRGRRHRAPARGRCIAAFVPRLLSERLDAHCCRCVAVRPRRA
jgi:hypothetical protein